jgi:hypothetical protein
MVRVLLCRTSRFFLLVSMLLVVVALANVRGAWADAPPCRYTIGIDTVLDNETMLTWQRYPSALLKNWDQASAYCSNLSIDGGGWRLPTIQELQTLVDESKYDPAIDTNAFPEPGFSLWSSSISATIGPTYAWTISFHSGVVFDNGGFMENNNDVRCVR